MQGCPIGNPKNPEISGSSRKISLGTAEEVHSARASTASLTSGGGEGSSRTQYEKSLDSSRNCVFFSVEYRDLEKSVDSAINHFFVRRLKEAIKIRRKRIFP